MRILTSLGHELVMANPARVRLIAEATLTYAKVDADTPPGFPARADRALLRGGKASGPCRFPDEP
jgi:hypothetical protein